MYPNPILLILFSFLPALIAARRKTTNRKNIFIVNGIVGVINIYMSLNMLDSLSGLGFEGFGIVTILSFVGWLWCLISAIRGKKEQQNQRHNDNPNILCSAATRNTAQFFMMTKNIFMRIDKRIIAAVLLTVFIMSGITIRAILVTDGMLAEQASMHYLAETNPEYKKIKDEINQEKLRYWQTVSYIAYTFNTIHIPLNTLFVADLYNIDFLDTVSDSATIQHIYFFKAIEEYHE